MLLFPINCIINNSAHNAAEIPIFHRVKVRVGGNTTVQTSVNPTQAHTVPTIPIVSSLYDSVSWPWLCGLSWCADVLAWASSFSVLDSSSCSLSFELEPPWFGDVFGWVSSLSISDFLFFESSFSLDLSGWSSRSVGPAYGASWLYFECGYVSRASDAVCLLSRR